jgi:hypothetical protein
MTDDANAGTGPPASNDAASSTVPHGAGQTGGPAPVHPEQRPLWEGDPGTLAFDSRRALVELLRGPMVAGAKKPDIWAAIDRDEAAIRARLADLFLDLVTDRNNRIAFVRNAETGEVAVPQTVRSRRLTLMQSVILLHLRSLYMRSTEERVIVGEDEVRDAVSAYGRAASADESTYLKRFNSAWTALKDASILQAAATPGRYEVSPVIAILFGVDEVRTLQAEYDRLLAEAGAGAGTEAGVGVGKDAEAGAEPEAGTDSGAGTESGAGAGAEVAEAGDEGDE